MLLTITHAFSKRSFAKTKWRRLPAGCLLGLAVLLANPQQTLNAQDAQDARGAAPNAPTRLDAFQPLFYRDGSQVKTATTVEQWQKRRAEVIRGMQQVMGALPQREGDLRLDMKIVEDDDVGAYVRRLITYRADRGEPVTAYLCIPKSVLNASGKPNGKKAPAVLCLHPTDNKIGHKVVVGLGGRPNRQYASEQAERGYITLSPAYPHLADYYPNLGKHRYISGTMKAIWDNIRGLDLLDELPYVDSSNGYGAIGHSLGGHNSIYTAVMDDRIKVVVSSCGFDSYRDYYKGEERFWLFGKGWCQIRYMPRLSNYRGRLTEIPFDFPELVASLAPRPFFVNAPLHDGNFQADSVDRCAAAAQGVYRLFDAEDNLVVRHPDSNHDFPNEVRMESYRFIDAALRP